MNGINILTYKELLKDGVEYNTNDIFKFNDIGFKNVLATIATCKLHPKPIIKEEDYIKHIISIFNGDLFTMRYSKILVIKFFKIKKTKEYDTAYQSLINKTYNIVDFIKDIDIDNFVSEEITDIINLKHHKWYEENCLNMITNRVFMNVNEIRLKSFFDKVEKDESGSMNRAVDKLLNKTLKDNYSKISNDLYLLLLRVFDYKHSPSIFSNYLLQSFAIDYRLYNVLYSKNIVFLRKTAKQVVDSGLSKRQTKKPRL